MAEETKSTRRTIAKKVYIDGDGKEGKYPTPETVSVELRFGPEGKAGTLQFDLSKIGPKCAIASQWHGATDKIANAYNKAETPEQAMEWAGAMLERMSVAEDEWTKPGTGAGPSTNLLVLAIRRCLERSGEEVDDDREAKIRAKVTGEDGRKNALANDAIKAEYEAVRAEQAAKRAEVAQAKAADSGATLKGF